MTTLKFDIARFISRGIQSGGEWNDLLREILTSARADKSFFADLHNNILAYFQWIKEQILIDAQKRKDYHKGLLVQSENGNPFKLNHIRPNVLPFEPNQLRALILSPNFHLCKPNHFLGENMIGAQGLEDLRAGWAKTQTEPIEEIKVPFIWVGTPKDLNERMSFANIETLTQLSVKDIEELESGFKAACETVMRSNGIEYGTVEYSAPGISFGLTENQLGTLYDGLVNIGNLDDKTSKTDFVNIHLGSPSTGKITFLRGGKTSSEMPLIVEMYFQLGVFVTVNKGLARMANISEDFQSFLQEHYANSLSSLHNQGTQFKSGATKKAKEIITLIKSIKSQIADNQRTK